MNMMLKTTVVAALLAAVAAVHGADLKDINLKGRTDKADGFQMRTGRCASGMW
jgi:hypothetical protein